MKKYEVVSVPLRGLWFLSTGNRHTDETSLVESFRPLAGIMVLITWKRNSSGFNRVVSVPLRGLWFLSKT